MLHTATNGVTLADNTVQSEESWGKRENRKKIVRKGGLENDWGRNGKNGKGKGKEENEDIGERRGSKGEKGKSIKRYDGKRVMKRTEMKERAKLIE